MPEAGERIDRSVRPVVTVEAFRHDLLDDAPGQRDGILRLVLSVGAVESSAQRLGDHVDGRCARETRRGGYTRQS